MRPRDLLIILDCEFTSTEQGHHTPVMLWGPPGVGKSQLVAQTAARHKSPMIDIRLSQMEPSDLRGIPFRSGATVDWAIPAMLPDVGRHGERGILFLDEITSAPPSVSAAAYQLILDRRLGAYQVPPGWAIVAAGSARHKSPMIDIRLSQMEPSDLRGIPFRSGATVDWAIPAMLPDVGRHGERGILFLDEITSAPPSVSAAAYQLILDRRLGAYQVPPGWAIVAAGNRQGDRGISYTMPSPLANRFSHFEVETHLDDWVDWAWGAGIDEAVIGFLRYRPELLFDFDPEQNPIAFPSPRSWEFAHRAVQKFRNQPRLFQGALQACVGPAAGVELAAFIESLDQLPDLDAIVRGEAAQVPREIDLQYAVASALVGRAIRAQQQPEDGLGLGRTLGNILRYAGRFPQREMGVMLVSDLHRAIGQRLFEVPEFGDWAGIVADIML